MENSNLQNEKIKEPRVSVLCLVQNNDNLTNCTFSWCWFSFESYCKCLACVTP